jgi:hypothetical protein
MSRKDAQKIQMFIVRWFVFFVLLCGVNAFYV